MGGGRSGTHHNIPSKSRRYYIKVIKLNEKSSTAPCGRITSEALGKVNDLSKAIAAADHTRGVTTEREMAKGHGGSLPPGKRNFSTRP